ncbi:MAG: AAA family ATPase, partial [Anaerolineaceae bacterium]|nr:AAA family ATPase [Anaerolineaceae bacterium]
VNGQQLATVESMNTEPSEFYARKRVGLYNVPSAGTQLDVLSVISKFVNLETELNRNLIGMQDAVHVALLGLLSGDNVFLLSKPGAAKSTLAGLIGDSFGGEKHFFKKNFTPDMSMSDLYGPLSVEKINQGLYEREWAGIATCSYALLDEFYKGSATIQNNCLEIIEEHTISLAHRRINVPLLGVISASNELVNANANSATWDRFGYRLELDYSEDESDIFDMFKAKGGHANIATRLDPEEILLIQGYIDYMAKQMPDGIYRTMSSITKKLLENGIRPSPRRREVWARAVIAEYLLTWPDNRDLDWNDTDQYNESLSVGANILWVEPEQRQAVSEIVTLSSKSEKAVIRKFKADMESIRNASAKYDLSKAAKAYGMIEKAMEELKNSVSSPKYAKAVEEEILKAKALQGEIYSNAAKNMKKEQ